MSNEKVINLNFGSKNFEVKPFWIMAAILLLLIFLSRTVLIVNAGHRAIVFNSFIGVEKRTLGEGIHFLVPGVETPTTYSVRTETYTMSGRQDEGQQQGDDAIECLTSDGQKIRLDLSVIYNLIPENLWELHKQIGPDYVDKIIRPSVRSIARNTIANYTVTELYSGNRDKLQDEISLKVKNELDKYYVNSTETMIRNVVFSEEFSKAIEQKQVAMQDAERMKYILEKEKREKERKIIESEGQAIAISKKGAALKANPLLIRYEYVDKLAPGVKTIITNQSSILNFPGDLLKDEK
ncbi:MAG: prohibitin family protein [bacterium]